ncbi:hypothetical protein EDD85DRAFT_1000255 [Armillaria nabsnona]|nr:hypothetical protein EDD85DRAFT_1000255 [Armillaria nabsnona]
MPCMRTVPQHFSSLPFILLEDSNVTVNSVMCHVEVQHLSFLPPSSRPIPPSPPLLNSIPMPGLNTKVQNFEGWHYNVFSGVVPRQWVHGRDLGMTFSMPIVTFESTDSILSSHIHFPSATLTTPSISIAAQDFSQYFSSHNDSLISQDSSFDDLSSSSTAFSLPMGIGLGILGLTRKEGGDPFDGLGLVHINRSSRDPSSDVEISHTILREAALTSLQPLIPVESVILGHSEPQRTKPVDMPSPQNCPCRSLTHNVSASTISSSLKRASKTGALSKVINTILHSQQLLSEELKIDIADKLDQSQIYSYIYCHIANSIDHGKDWLARLSVAHVHTLLVTYRHCNMFLSQEEHPSADGGDKNLENFILQSAWECLVYYTGLTSDGHPKAPSVDVDIEALRILEQDRVTGWTVTLYLSDMAGQLQPGFGPELDEGVIEGQSASSKLVDEGNKERWFWRCGSTFEHSTFAGDIPFIPIPASDTILFNIRLDYGQRQQWEHASGCGIALMKKVTADYVQGMHLVFSISGPASDDNEWGLELKWLKWTPQRPMDSPPSIASIPDGDTNLITPSETVEEMQHATGSDFSEDGELVLEVTADSSATMRPEEPSASSVAGPQIDLYFAYNYRKSWSITLPKVTLSAFTETGQAESSIDVPKQQSYTGRSPVISSSLADTPCATLGIEGVLGQLNATLGTSYTLDTPSLLSLLNECIEKNNDFGTAYALLRPIINPELLSRRVWDLVSNHVVPSWATGFYEPKSVPVIDLRNKSLQPISHAWVDEKDRMDVWTSINGKAWLVPIPKGACLELIWIEMLNLGLEYTWLDVLCLRQKGGLWENLHVEEWKLDVPTIGYVYDNIVVVYLSGLGKSLSLKDGDLDIQEVGRYRIIAGDTPDGPMHARTIDEDGNYETALLTRFHKQLKSVQESRGLFSRLAEMKKRVATNPVDKVAGLAFPLWPDTIPAYHESQSLENAWTALVDAMNSRMRVDFLFGYPGAGLGCKKWRPTWMQVMTGPLSYDHTYYNNNVEYDKETGEDWFEGYCIEKGLVQGLDVGLAEGCDQCGELVVEDANRIAHTFKIHVTHQCLIPEDVYTLLGDFSKWFPSTSGQAWAVGRRLPGQKFEKVSVFRMDSLEEVNRLKDLDGYWVQEFLVIFVFFLNFSSS